MTAMIHLRHGIICMSPAEADPGSTLLDPSRHPWIQTPWRRRLRSLEDSRKPRRRKRPGRYSRTLKRGWSIRRTRRFVLELFPLDVSLTCSRMDLGAHLPGFPATNWTTSSKDATCSPLSGITSAGIKAYRTTFNLNLPFNSDIPIALQFERTPTSSYRSVIYVNGWQFGRFNSRDGPQTVFPVSSTC